MGWRYIAQRTLAGDWLHWDLPLSGAELTWTLSGPDSLSAKIEPEMVSAMIGNNDPVLHASGTDDAGQPILDEWSTTIYAEADGILQLGAIVSRLNFAKQTLNVECTGYAGYPHGLPFLGHIQSESIDPLNVVRKIWDHVQSYGDGNLHMRIDGTKSPVRIGSKPKHVAFTTGEGSDVDFEADEKYKLVWWEASDCGDEIDKLAKSTPFDYHEEHKWVGSGEPDVGGAEFVAGFTGTSRRWVVQSFVRDEKTGEYYAAQVEAHPGEHESTRIYRLNSSGSVLDYATLRGAGHGNSITLERDSDDVWIWTWWASDTSGNAKSNTPVRWKYQGREDGMTVLRDDAGVEQVPHFGSGYVTFAIDQTNDRIATRQHISDRRDQEFRLFRFTDYRAGRTDNQLGLVASDPGGFATDGDLYVWSAGGSAGHGHAPYLTRCEWATGKREIFDTSGYVPADTQGSHDEGEGVQVYHDDEGKHVLFGKASGLLRHRRATVWELLDLTGDIGQVGHRLRLDYPRAGRRRTDLRFVLGENITEPPKPTRDGDDFANEVYGVGKGEGSDSVHARMPAPDGRLRRCHVTSIKSVGSKHRLRNLMRADLDKRSKLIQLDEIKVFDHPNARIGSWRVGDDILVEADLDWWPGFKLWCRITEWTMNPEDGEVATLQLARSDSFSYGSVEVG